MCNFKTMMYDVDDDDDDDNVDEVDDDNLDLNLDLDNDNDDCDHSVMVCKGFKDRTCFNIKFNFLCDAERK